MKSLINKSRFLGSLLSFTLLPILILGLFFSITYKTEAAFSNSATNIYATNGTVDTSIPDGSGGVYIGGEFTTVGGLTRNNLAHIKSDGTVDGTWNPNVNSRVWTLTISGSTLYAGGSFTTVNQGTTPVTRNHLAAFNLTDGTVDGTWNPDVNGAVYTLTISDSTLYAGGGFSTVNQGTTPVTRNRLAAFNLTNGTVDGTWNPNVNSSVMTLTISGSTIYVGGYFTKVNGTSVTRNRLAAFNLTNGTVDGTWNPNVNNDVQTLTISGSTIYVGGNFTKVNGTSVTRNRLAAFNLTNGTVDGTWNPNVDNTVYTLTISGSTIYVGGFFTTVNGSIARTRLATFNLTDGIVDGTWNPNVNTNVDNAVYTLTISGPTIYVGGNFYTINGNYSQGFASFAPNSAPNIPSSLSPTSKVDGSSSSNTQPTLTFTLTDPDGLDTNKYQIIISTHSDFSSPVVDYTSALNAQGSNSFSIGQAAGSGTYTTGAESQTLAYVSYYWEVRAIDAEPLTSSYAVANSGAVAFVVVPNSAPNIPSSLSPTDKVDGSTSNTFQPTLTFTLTDPDGLDTNKYQIIISTHSDFSSPVVDYTSALNAQGSNSFSIGQAAGSGTYTTGAESQTLAYGSYYWEVRAIDAEPLTSSYAVANSGAVAFVVFNSAPNIPSSLSPTSKVDGSSSSNTQPTLTFTLTDPNGSDTNKYEIIISTHSDFSSPVVDYTSALNAQGVNSFTVGQAEGSGTYTVGSESQDLPDGSYYWEVRGIDAEPLMSSYAVANSGTVAFVVVHTAQSNYGPFSSTPSNSYATDGAVNTSIPDGSGGVYIGGQFNNVGIPSGNGIAIDPSTGVVDSTFPNVTGGIIASISDGSGGWYIGGSFTKVGSLTRNYLAHIKSDGTVDTNWNPDVNNYVLTLAISGSKLYAGGRFTSANQSTTPVNRNYIAAFNLTDGTVDATWNPDVDGWIQSIIISNSTLYAGGNFTNTNQGTIPITRNNLAAFNLTDGTVDGTWNPDVNSGVNSLTISDSKLYAGGSFTTVNQGTIPITRNNLATFNLTDGTVDSTWNPDVNSGVNSLTISGSTLYAGGGFSSVNQGITPVTRNSIAAFNLTDGTVDTIWNPDVNGFINTLIVSGSNLYTGGEFTTVNQGTTPVTRNNIAAFNLTDGAVYSNWSPYVNTGDVYTLSISGSAIYVGGYFDMTNPIPRPNLAHIKSDGTVDTTWNPDVNGYVETITISGSKLYAGGDFTTVNQSTTPVTRNRLAAFNLTDGTVDSTWNPDVDSLVHSITISGPTLYAGGQLTTVNQGTIPVTRNYLAAFNLTDGTVDPTWNPDVSGYIYTTAIDNSKLYAGGGFSTVNQSTTSVTRHNLAAFNLTDGTVDGTWNPDVYNTVSAIVISGSTLYAGGHFTTVNGLVPRNRLAAFNLTDGTVTSWDPNVNNDVFALTIYGSSIYAGGRFTSVNGSTSRKILAAFNLTDGTADSWSPEVWNFGSDNSMWTITVSGSTLYTGGYYISVDGINRQYFSAFTSLEVVPPVISSVSANPSSNSSVISWTTNELASSIVSYGTTASYGTTTTETDISPMVTSHSVTLSNLNTCTTYHYKVKSNNSLPTLGQGVDNAFTTLGCISVSRGGGGGRFYIPIAISPTPPITTTTSKTTLATDTKTTDPITLDKIPKIKTDKILRLGTINTSVQEVQQFLNSVKFTVAKRGAGSLGSETTYFGPLTQKALIRFQKANGLTSDGIAGPNTIGKINQLLP